MIIYDGTNDKAFVPTNHTISVISWGYLSACGTTSLTLRKKGRKDWSLFYCESGCVHFREHNLKPGELWIYPPDAPQEYRVYEDEETSYYFVHFTGSDILNMFNSLGIVSGLNYPNTDIIHLLNSVGSSYNKNDSLGKVECEYLMIKLICTLSLQNRKKTRSFALDNIIMEMNKNYASKYNSEYYSAIACVSIHRFNHIFKEYTGGSPKAYFIDIKINRGAFLLETTDMSVSEVAAAVGYDDAFAFSKIFKGKIGCSPIIYKKRFLF